MKPCVRPERFVNTSDRQEEVMTTMNQRKKTDNMSQRTAQATSNDHDGDLQEVIDTVTSALSKYGRAHPITAASLIFGLGFYVGWKVKPW